MPRSQAAALEKVTVRAAYYTKAAGPKKAEAACKAGKVDKDEADMEEGDEEWIATVSLEYRQ